MNMVSTYTKGLLSNIRNDFKKILRSGSKNDIHHFRVSLKKIFALLDTISVCYPTEKPHFKKLHKLFKQLGEIRELQILFSELRGSSKSKNNDFDAVLKEIKNEEVIKFDQFQNKYQESGYAFFKKVESWVSSTLKKVPKHTYEEFLISKQKRLFSLMFQITDDPLKMHDFRKEVKSVIYNIEGLKTSNSCKYISLGVLKKWNKQLGDWHDSVQILKNLKRFDTGNKKNDPFNSKIYQLTDDHSKQAQMQFKAILKHFDAQMKKICKSMQ